MAKIETYDALFRGMAETVLHVIDNDTHAIALAKIVWRSKRAVLDEYFRINSAVKAEYMENAAGRIDRHKCAAAFMLAFEKRLITALDEPVYETYREKIAIVVGLSVMGTLIKAEAMAGGNLAMIEHLERNGGLVLPKLLFDAGPYERNWAMELRKAYYAKRDIDLAVLSLSNELFLLESLGIQIVNGQNPRLST